MYTYEIEEKNGKRIFKYVLVVKKKAKKKKPTNSLPKKKKKKHITPIVITDSRCHMFFSDNKKKTHNC